MAFLVESLEKWETICWIAAMIRLFHGRWEDAFNLANELSEKGKLRLHLTNT